MIYAQLGYLWIIACKMILNRYISTLGLITGSRHLVPIIFENFFIFKYVFFAK